MLNRDKFLTVSTRVLLPKYTLLHASASCPEMLFFAALNGVYVEMLVTTRSIVPPTESLVATELKRRLAGMPGVKPPRLELVTVADAKSRLTS